MLVKLTKDLLKIGAYGVPFYGNATLLSSQNQNNRLVAFDHCFDHIDFQ